MGKYSKDHLESILNMDDPNEHEDQRVRQRNARKCEIISFSEETQTAEFKGSGEKSYVATLDSCTCQDFGMRGLPCKHIYRLMHELGRFDLNAVPEGRTSVPTPARELFDPEILNSLSQGALKELYALVREWIAWASSNSWLFSRSNAEVKELISGGFLEEFEDAGKSLSIIEMSELRKTLNPYGIKIRSKRDATPHILNLAPGVLEHTKREYVLVRFNESIRPIRGQIRNFLKPQFPDFPEEMETTDMWHVTRTSTLRGFKD